MSESTEDPYFQHARREMFPKMKGAAFSLMHVSGEEPDPKFCLELGAAIMFDKPIMVVYPRGREVPLSLRTIAHCIVTVDDPPTEADSAAMQVAIRQMLEAGKFRGKPREENT